MRTLAQNVEVPDPFKTRPVSPLRSLPSCSGPNWLKPDPAHTYAIAGWGKDCMASSILVLVRLMVFGAGSLQKRLDEGFGRFKDYCRSAHKTTSLTEFSLKAFKIQKLLSLMWYTVGAAGCIVQIQQSMIMGLLSPEA